MSLLQIAEPNQSAQPHQHRCRGHVGNQTKESKELSSIFHFFAHGSTYSAL